MPDPATADSSSPAKTPMAAGFGDLLMAGAIAAYQRLSEEATDSAAQLRQLGRLSLTHAEENANRLSAAFGVRAAQTNPVEAASIATLKASGSGEMAQSNSAAGVIAALAAAMMNLAHVTPATQAPPTQAK